MPSPRDPCPAQPGGELQCTVNGEENSLLIDRGASVVFGHPWHVDSSKADALLGGRKRTATKSLINAFESNAPRSLLDNHHVGMIRDARGTEKKVMDMAAAATRRVGKTNSNGFRVVRFTNDRVQSCTYNGHETAPYPFSRGQTPPLRAVDSPENGGRQAKIMTTVTNDYVEGFPRDRLMFVLTAGNHRTNHGTIKSTVLSDDRKYTVVTVHLDISGRREFRVRVESA